MMTIVSRINDPSYITICCTYYFIIVLHIFYNYNNTKSLITLTIK